MKLSNQALGALMMALQKSLLEQSDIVPVLKDMDFQLEEVDTSRSQVVVDLVTNTLASMGDSATLIVQNPPVVKLEGTYTGNDADLDDTVTALADEDGGSTPAESS